MNFDDFQTVFIKEHSELLINSCADKIKSDLKNLLDEKHSTSMSEDIYLAEVTSIIIKYSTDLSISNPLYILHMYHNWLTSNFQLIEKN